MKKFLFFLLLFANAIFAQDKLAQDKSKDPKQFEQYQGQFIKKSIAVTDLIDIRQGSKNSLKKYSNTSNQIRNNLRLKRFDINHIEKTSEHDEFIESIEKRHKSTIANADRIVEASLTKYLADKILNITKDSSSSRAKQMITDAQASSMLATKAKEEFVYESQIETKANESFVFVPAVTNFFVARAPDSISRKNIPSFDYRKGFRVFRSEGSYMITVYQIKKISTTNVKITRLKRVFRTISSQTIAHQKQAFSLMYDRFITSIASDINTSNIPTEIEKINAFLLTEQIISVKDNEVYFPLGENEDIKTNDKFWHTTRVETKNGIEERKNGWVIVSKQGKTKDNYLSSAQTIKGNPDVGDVVKEIPMTGAGFNFGADSEPIKNRKININGNVIKDFDIGRSTLFNINTRVLIGSGAGIKQLWFFLGYGVGGGSASGFTIHNESEDDDYDKNLTSRIDGYFASTFKTGFTKKFYFKRLAISPMIYFNYRTIDIFADDVYLPFYSYEDREFLGNTNLYWTYRTAGATIGSSFEFAITPKFNIGGSVEYFINPSADYLNLYASSSSVLPTFSALAKFFKSFGENSDDIAGNDRIRYFDYDREKVDICNHGLGFSLYLSTEF